MYSYEEQQQITEFIKTTSRGISAVMPSCMERESRRSLEEFIASPTEERLPDAFECFGRDGVIAIIEEEQSQKGIFSSESMTPAMATTIVAGAALAGLSVLNPVIGVGMMKFTPLVLKVAGGSFLLKGIVSKVKRKKRG